MKQKTILIILISFITTSCTGMCDCKYVKTESNPTTGYKWKQTYIDKWDASCANETLSNSTYIDTQGRKWYSKTQIKCK